MPRKGTTSRFGTKHRLVTMSDIDRRTKAGQLAVETKAAIISDLGGEDGLSTLERLMAEHAAMCAAILMDLHVRWLRGETVSLGERNAVENTFTRTAALLGLTRRTKDITPDLYDYIRSKVEDDDDGHDDPVPEASGEAVGEASDPSQGHQDAEG